MVCKNCDTPTAMGALELQNRLCEACYQEFCFCRNCKRKISYENSQKNENLCTICVKKIGLPRYTRQRILNLVGLLNKILISFMVVSVMFVLTAVFGKAEFKWLEVTFKLEHGWIVFLLLSICHLFVYLLLNQTISEVNNQKKRFAHLIEEVSASDNLFFMGFIPKVSWEEKRRKFRRDINMLLYVLTFTLMFCAISLIKPSITFFITALLFTFFNITIANRWVVMISLMGDNR